MEVGVSETDAVVYEVLTPRLRLFAADPGLTDELHELVEANVDYLRPWMPWIRFEPMSLPDRVALLRDFRAKFDVGEDYFFHVQDRRTGRLIGASGLHDRVGPHALEIGYWMAEAVTGRGYATEAAGALARVALEIYACDRVELRIEPDNLPSLKIPQKLGFVREGTLRRRILDASGQLTRDAVVWSLFAEDYPDSPVARLPMEARDARGGRLPLRSTEPSG